jgi:hypothetical protein
MNITDDLKECSSCRKILLLSISDKVTRKTILERLVKVIEVKLRDGQQALNKIDPAWTR